MNVSSLHLSPSFVTGLGTSRNLLTLIMKLSIARTTPSGLLQRELDSLEARKAFECTVLPPGCKAIGVCWTFNYKYHPDGSVIRGKEKVRLVAQGFSQCPEDYDETYAQVVKLASVRILLAFANCYDIEIMAFDVKTAFLHACLPYDIFIKQIPGYPEEDSSIVLRLLVALYGLKQASHEWYKLLSTLLAALGLLRCEADHAVFVGRWTSPPLPSIPLPSSGSPLFLIIPIHVDDGLAVSNSLPLYNWFVLEILKSIKFISLGPVINTRYLGQHLVRDCAAKTIQLSQYDLILSLLEDWGLVFEGPVHTTGKKPQLNQTEPQKNRTVSCSLGFSEIKNRLKPHATE